MGEVQFLNKTQCKHNGTLRKEGLCSKCSENKPYMSFRWCDAKACPKDTTCTHAGGFLLGLGAPPEDQGIKITWTK